MAQRPGCLGAIFLLLGGLSVAVFYVHERVLHDITVGVLCIAVLGALIIGPGFYDRYCAIRSTQTTYREKYRANYRANREHAQSPSHVGVVRGVTLIALGAVLAGFTAQNWQDNYVFYLGAFVAAVIGLGGVYSMARRG